MPFLGFACIKRHPWQPRERSDTAVQMTSPNYVWCCLQSCLFLLNHLPLRQQHWVLHRHWFQSQCLPPAGLLSNCSMYLCRNPGVPCSCGSWLPLEYLLRNERHVDIHSAACIPLTRTCRTCQDSQVEHYGGQKSFCNCLFLVRMIPTAS